MVTECLSVPREILRPRGVWADASAYDAAAHKLGALFRENFTKYETGVQRGYQGRGCAMTIGAQEHGPGDQELEGYSL